MTYPYDLILKHPHRYNFNSLALCHPQLYPHLLLINFKTTIDFSNPESLRALTTALMKYLCGVEWTIPKGKLCPRVPNRLNYLMWVRELMKERNQCVEDVLDVGTGAGLVYPVLGTVLFGWRFVATEIDQESYGNCSDILEKNQQLSSIQLIKSNGQLLEGLIDKAKNFSALICNPPFFEQLDETIRSQMSNSQHHTEDGQYGFVFKLYGQGLAYRNIKLFTSLIGRRTSFYEIKKFLQGEKKAGLLTCTYYGMLLQGNCQRYVAAWSYSKP